MKTKWVGLFLTAALAVGLLAGCGAASKATEDGEAAAPETLKVALILSGPANDQGWNATALEGLNEENMVFPCKELQVKLQV